jgi:hypothetical protein
MLRNFKLNNIFISDRDPSPVPDPRFNYGSGDATDSADLETVPVVPYFIVALTPRNQYGSMNLCNTIMHYQVRHLHEKPKLTLKR